MKLSSIIGWFGFFVVIATLAAYLLTPHVTEMQAKIGGIVGIVLMFASGLPIFRRP